MKVRQDKKFVMLEELNSSFEKFYQTYYKAIASITDSDRSESSKDYLKALEIIDLQVMAQAKSNYYSGYKTTSLDFYSPSEDSEDVFEKLGLKFNPRLENKIYDFDVAKIKLLICDEKSDVDFLDLSTIELQQAAKEEEFNMHFSSLLRMVKKIKSINKKLLDLLNIFKVIYIRSIIRTHLKTLNTCSSDEDELGYFMSKRIKYLIHYQLFITNGQRNHRAAY